MANDVTPILNYLHVQRGVDFSGYRISLIERQLKQRFSSTGCHDTAQYLDYLKSNPYELDSLLEILTIHVSCFFRDTLTFEYIADKILPEIVNNKKESNDRSLRVWSAGCSMGEEAYSAAILIHELLEKESLNFDFHIFATDIDEKILLKATRATYPFESVSGVKFGLLKKYFGIKEDVFQLIPKIRDSVSFSIYDILDKKTIVPSESVFGSFDLVFCRNLLIYFDPEHQEEIVRKLYRSLSKNGFLVLGGAEIPPAKYKACLSKVIACCHIYQKI
jgi:chemotaxis protein methyltransferase CheR